LEAEVVGAGIGTEGEIEDLPQPAVSPLVQKKGTIEVGFEV
jgi:hypothetical protein